MDFHYELLEETRKEIKNIRFFREDVEIKAEEYEVIHPKIPNNFIHW